MSGWNMERYPGDQGPNEEKDNQDFAIGRHHGVERRIGHESA